jgi:hypothetical protein
LHARELITKCAWRKRRRQTKLAAIDSARISASIWLIPGRARLSKLNYNDISIKQLELGSQSRDFLEQRSGIEESRPRRGPWSIGHPV